MQVKPSGAKLDYPITYDLAAGETISLSAWSVSPSGTGAPVVSAEAINGAVTSCLVAGGVSGRVYELVNAITTSHGRDDQRTITIRIGAMEATR